MQRPDQGGSGPLWVLLFIRLLLGSARGWHRAPVGTEFYLHLPTWGSGSAGDGPAQMTTDTQAFLVCHITQGQKPDTSLRAQRGRYSSWCKI